VVYDLQSGLVQQISDRCIDLLKVRTSGRLPGNQQYVPSGMDGWQPQADRFSHHSLDPIADDGIAKSAADRERKAAVWHFICTFYQDQPAIMA